MSSNRNANWTRIRARGTPGAFEPGFVQQASTVGPSHGPVLTGGSPYKVIDVNVDITGTNAGDLIILGDAITDGCVFLQQSLNGNSTLTDEFTTLSAGVSYADVAPADPNVPILSNFAATIGVFGAGTINAGAGTINGGVVKVEPETITTGTALPIFPILRITNAPTAPAGGVVNVKIVIFCP